MKRYRLLKDLPDGSKVGDIYEKGESFYWNTRIHNEATAIDEGHRWDTWQVEGNPSWFELIPEETKKERIEVKHVFYKEKIDGKYGNVLKVYFPYEVEYEKEENRPKFQLIKQAIESILNNDKEELLPIDEHLGIDRNGYETKKEFTRYQLEQAFEAGRERIGLAWNAPIKNWQYETFNDYMRSKFNPQSLTNQK